MASSVGSFSINPCSRRSPPFRLPHSRCEVSPDTGHNTVLGNSAIPSHLSTTDSRFARSNKLFGVGRVCSWIAGSCHPYAPPKRKFGQESVTGLVWGDARGIGVILCKSARSSISGGILCGNFISRSRISGKQVWIVK